MKSESWVEDAASVVVSFYEDVSSSSESQISRIQEIINAHRPKPPSFIQDFPENDCTDFAHPAWWRGNDAGVAGAVRSIKDILDSKEIHGVCQQPLQGIRERVHALLSEPLVSYEEVAQRAAENWFGPPPMKGTALYEESVNRRDENIKVLTEIILTEMEGLRDKVCPTCHGNQTYTLIEHDGISHPGHMIKCPKCGGGVSVEGLRGVAEDYTDGKEVPTFNRDNDTPESDLPKMEGLRGEGIEEKLDILIHRLCPFEPVGSYQTTSPDKIPTRNTQESDLRAKCEAKIEQRKSSYKSWHLCSEWWDELNDASDLAQECLRLLDERGE